MGYDGTAGEEENGGDGDAHMDIDMAVDEIHDCLLFLFSECRRFLIPWLFSICNVCPTTFYDSV